MRGSLVGTRSDVDMWGFDIAIHVTAIDLVDTPSRRKRKKNFQDQSTQGSDTWLPSAQ